ncbi:MAG: SelB C-terminal domain-containing protein, partial [Myxococcota bacterium]
RLSNLDFSQLTDRFEIIDDGYFSTVETIDVAKDALMTVVRDALVSPTPRVVISISEVHEALRQRFATSLLSYAERRLVDAGELQRHAHGLSLPGRDPFSGLGKARMERLSTLESDLRLGGLSPPALAALQGERGRNADLVELLVGSGRAVYLRNVALKQTLLFHSEALEDAVQRLTRAFPPPRQFSMSEARRALQTSRKYAVPLLEHFDKIGLTKRSGNVRFLVSEVL